MLTHDLNPLIYTYGSALFLALALASPAFSRILIGLAILIPFHALGLAFEMLAEIAASLPADRGERRIVGFKRELVPLGYQLGSLIFSHAGAVVPLGDDGRAARRDPRAFPARPTAS